MIIKERQIGDCRLILGDSLSVIPLLTGIDGVATDPPYGIEDIVTGYGRGKETIENDKCLTVCHEVLNLIGRQFNDIRVMAFYSCRVTKEFYNGIESLDYFGDIVWDKMVPGMGGKFRYQHENIAIFTKGTPPPIGEGFSIMRHMRSPDEHPHQKPVELMKKLIRICQGNKILDPFMGSGSTIVACAKLGLSAVGIELDPVHYETACRRVEAAYAQGDMFIAPVIPQQEKLL